MLISSASITFTGAYERLAFGVRVLPPRGWSNALATGDSFDGDRGVANPVSPACCGGDIGTPVVLSDERVVLVGGHLELGDGGRLGLRWSGLITPSQSVPRGTWWWLIRLGSRLWFSLGFEQCSTWNNRIVLGPSLAGLGTIWAFRRIEAVGSPWHESGALEWLHRKNQQVDVLVVVSGVSWGRPWRWTRLHRGLRLRR